jgi:hypothetical protein
MTLPTAAELWHQSRQLAAALEFAVARAHYPDALVGNCPTCHSHSRRQPLPVRQDDTVQACIDLWH